jgi:Toprim-like
MLAGTAAPPLALADLEAFDPQAPPRDGERRFCCPLPACADKPVDADHRSLSAHMSTGLWHCARCQAGGKLREWWTAPTSGRARSRAAVARAFRLTPEPAPAAPEAAPWWPQWTATEPLADTPGARYLMGRGIPIALAAAAGVRRAPTFYGRPAVVFPLTDAAGQLIAVTGRHTDGRDDPKAHTAGPKSQGLFATPGALAADPLVITEAPIDALALAACGVPAVALCGTTGPRWLARCAALRPVLLALDNDRAGDAGAAKVGGELVSLGARCERLRPARKDWAEDLAAVGRAVLTAQLAERLGRPEAPAPPAPWAPAAARALLVDLYARVQAPWPQLTPAAQREAAAILQGHEPALHRAWDAQDAAGYRAAVDAAAAALAPYLADGEPGNRVRTGEMHHAQQRARLVASAPTRARGSRHAGAGSCGRGLVH